MKRIRRRREEERGFVLIAVMLVLVIMVATVALTLREATSGLKEAQSIRSRALVSGAMEHGLNQALDELQTMDPAELANPNLQWDIFDANAPGVQFVGDGVENDPFSYPTDGDLAGAMEVRVGLRPGQRTRAPVGEDVRNAYGQIVEIQLSVRAVSFGAEAEERAAVGVRIPQTTSHSN